MSKTLWPEDEAWPGARLGEAFRRGANGSGEVRVIRQSVGEDHAEFQARFTTEKASAPEALWICAVWESLR